MDRDVFQLMDQEENKENVSVAPCTTLEQESPQASGLGTWLGCFRGEDT